MKLSGNTGAYSYAPITSQLPQPSTVQSAAPYSSPLSTKSSDSFDLSSSLPVNTSSPNPFASTDTSASSGGGQVTLIQGVLQIMQAVLALVSQLIQSNGNASAATSNMPSGSGVAPQSASAGASGAPQSTGSPNSNPFSNANYNGNSSPDGSQPVDPNSGNGDPYAKNFGVNSNGTPSNGAAGSTKNLFSGGKEGLGVNDTSSNGDGSNLASTKASWYYNWSPNTSSKVNDPNATFIPMIWGKKNMNSKDLQAAANSDSPMILTFNEPDLPSQANMTPQEALSNWSQLEATGKKLSSPAISNGPDGIKWLDQFMKGASAAGHRVDSISLHWYGSSGSSTEQNVAAMKGYIDQVHKKYPNLPINLTEFGVDASGLTAGKDQGFLTAAEKMLNDLPYVQMYSPYGLGAINGN